ncbi:hypothetical protein A3B85_00765 [Candidatus Nomurabacteria bacterium RIFCSPHIGHO2_02_FULL_37_13]|uniref:Type 4 fimbrial biogenesis protein PilX N-terminal domain-containing protein n=1 Tax=Candidatus Nomurabacteria bacterium RIFCSPHIGHO2_02_FULL_37_13 TaxID=1801750 RepID=A0A1F6W5C9_9BACT|nr:MAG: hypothetical protein A2640_03135 [Candidatus Nomurabacteria bacterium RIFCSPHIGHO2_01_FULL_36_23]OGI77012.1 MAG: hypothetical protein A3B85_00765 [Candidatus Nomurabacteria bacterium RIFCSPHIGHO2_02_FULL_37_13]OGI88610.1 MAG: hypothetical protein A2906_03235 [Candidatus Nomurabacteria bacterium RIFCSPLOWO2_01_FULL_37_25]
MNHLKIKTKKETATGFIALMSAIIISAILLLIVTNLSLTGFYRRSNVLDSELKEKSSALAEACIESARLILATDNSFIGNDTVNVGIEICDYKISSGGKIVAHGVAKNAHTFYEAVVNTNIKTIPIISFKELAISP